jgi:hypothetical protein
VAKLPGAKLGPPDFGGVTARRKQRAAENRDVDRSCMSSPELEFEEEIEVQLNEADDEDILFTCSKKNVAAKDSGFDNGSVFSSKMLKQSKVSEEIFDFDLGSLI